jgi:hypothetical protein
MYADGDSGGRGNLASLVCAAFAAPRVVLNAFDESIRQIRGNPRLTNRRELSEAQR